jgi:hypothetical protein
MYHVDSLLHVRVNRRSHWKQCKQVEDLHKEMRLSKFVTWVLIPSCASGVMLPQVKELSGDR